MKSTSVTLWVIAVALFCSSYNHLLNSCLCESIAPLALLHGVQRAIHQRLGMAVIYKQQALKEAEATGLFQASLLIA